jgi:hypothetical protein
MIHSDEDVELFNGDFQNSPMTIRLIVRAGFRLNTVEKCLMVSKKPLNSQNIQSILNAIAQSLGNL